MAEMDSTHSVPERYTVRHVLNMALAHKKELASAHIIAIFCSVSKYPYPVVNSIVD